jgi:replication initiation protein RepC
MEIAVSVNGEGLPVAINLRKGITMAIENSAHEAPRGGFAHSPTGFRRMTPGLLKADRSADDFAGLPQGVESHGQLLAALKAAAPRLGISPRLMHAIDWLFCFTKPQDWDKESRPIVWPSAREQQLSLALSPSQVKEINRRLIELGLVTMRDSANGKRYGKRDPKGRIVEAYGFDLSPVAARHAEFKRLAEEERAERRVMARLRRRKTIARKAIAQILETAREWEFDGEEWQTLARETGDLVRALRDVEQVDEMEAGVTSLERRQRAARERLEMLLRTVETAPKEAEKRPHIYNYNRTVHLEQDTVIAANGCSGEAGTGVTQSPAPTKQKRPEKGIVHGIAPEELPRLAPKLGRYVARPIQRGRTSSTRPATGCDRSSGFRNPSGAKPASSWAGSWPRSRSPSSRPRIPSISRAHPAGISTAWWPNTSPASCTSNAPSGPCAGRSSRNVTPERAADRTAAMRVGTGENRQSSPPRPHSPRNSTITRRPALRSCKLLLRVLKYAERTGDHANFGFCTDRAHCEKMEIAFIPRSDSIPSSTQIVSS